MRKNDTKIAKNYTNFGKLLDRMFKIVALSLPLLFLVHKKQQKLFFITNF